MILEMPPAIEAACIRAGWIIRAPSPIRIAPQTKEQIDCLLARGWIVVA